ncbi:cryptochrome/photolyase family protein, partial [Streptococcus suis]
MKTAHLIFGNQLFEAHPALAADPDQPIIMIEAHDVSARLPYHKHKLVLMIAAMRNYR